ncbi:hypothetical protein M413DRAFT_442722 [Hebeloma cylindrosporum]|uniref:2'-phosphotransferase n=1 Tax=Hebeloma cylindrosporum TaxID=76867 RepID=A0A0C3CKW4_HEBCY|nr:hypothetical protein M413DRAFT_442722 [Hebeloma cylindrosporum h7]
MTLRVFGKFTLTLKSISPSSCQIRHLHVSPQRLHSTVYTAAWPRVIEKEMYGELIDTLTFLLRRAVGREHGLRNRDDDYLSVKELLNHPQYRWMNMSTLQNIIDNDIKHRFILNYDPMRGDDCWWIRFKRWDEKHFVFKPLTRNEDVETAVYTTSPKAWNSHISRSGIPRPHDEYIRLSRVIPAINFLQNLYNESHVFIHVDVPKCVKAGLHFFLPTPTSQRGGVDTLVTKGDHLGYIPPDYFKQVQLVSARKNLLFGEPEPLPKLSWPREGQDYDENGQKVTFLATPERNLKGFVNLNPHRKMDIAIHPETRQEAKDVLNLH